MSKEAVWNKTQGLGSGFYYRALLTTGGKWLFQPWSKILAPAPSTRATAVELLKKWHKENGVDYAMEQCGVCHDFHNSADWVGDVCDTCVPLLPVCVLAGNHTQYVQYCKERGENPYTTHKFFEGICLAKMPGHHFSNIVVIGTFESRVDAAKILNYAKAHLDPSEAVMLCMKCGAYTKQTYAVGETKGLCKNCAQVKAQATIDKAKQMGVDKKPMKHGEVRKLPKANSPMFSTQWAAQGSGKLPYVVTHYDTKRDGAVTDEGWACSCASFCTNMPRADCKHICWVKKAEGIAISAPVSLLPKDQQEAFKKFLLQQAQQGTPALKSEGPKPFVTQGRRFR